MTRGFRDEAFRHVSCRHASSRNPLVMEPCGQEPAELSGQKSWTFPGDVSDLFRKCSGHFQEISWNCPGHFPEMSRKFPEHFRDISGKCSGGNVPEEMFRMFPEFIQNKSGSVLDVFRKKTCFFPENVRNISVNNPDLFRKCSGNVPISLRNNSGKTVRIMKQMKETMEADLKDAQAKEQERVAPSRRHDGVITPLRNFSEHFRTFCGKNPELIRNIFGTFPEIFQICFRTENFVVP